MEMASYSQCLVILLLSAFYPVLMRTLILEIKSVALYPHVGSSDPVEFHCHGRVIDEKEDEFFANGGRLVWLADDVIIAYTSVLNHHNDFVADPDKYFIAVHNLSSSNDENEYIFQLKLKYISVDDSKEYRCALLSAENKTIAESRGKSLTVQYAPEQQLYPQCSVDAISNDQRSVTLRCRSQTGFPPVHVYWTSPEGYAIGRASESKEFTESDLDVTIPIIDTEYVCVLNYSGDYEQIVKKCKVYPPRVSLLQSSQEVIEGGNAVFTCTVSAKPESISGDGVTWNSFPQLLSRNTSTSHNLFSQLIISNVTAQDNGTQITCHSRNILGENHQQALLIVKTHPFTVDINPRIAQVREGDIASFECRTTTYTNNYVYRWYYNGEEIDSESMSEKFVIQHTSQSLRIFSVDVADNNATIACVVIADGEEKTARASLLVWEPTFETSQSNSSGYKVEPWKFVLPISILSIILLVTWISCKTKDKCTKKEVRDHAVAHAVSQSVRYVASEGLTETPRNNSRRPSNLPSTSRASTKMVNHDVMVVNLPPVPPIPTEDVEQDEDTLRAAKKLGELEGYADMNSVRNNHFQQHENNEHSNQYQDVNDCLGRPRPTNRPENAYSYNISQVKQNKEEPPIY